MTAISFTASPNVDPHALKAVTWTVAAPPGQAMHGAVVTWTVQPYAKVPGSNAPESNDPGVLLQPTDGSSRPATQITTHFDSGSNASSCLITATNDGMAIITASMPIGAPNNIQSTTQAIIVGTVFGYPNGIKQLQHEAPSSGWTRTTKPPPNLPTASQMGTGLNGYGAAIYNPGTSSSWLLLNYAYLYHLHQGLSESDSTNFSGNPTPNTNLSPTAPNTPFTTYAYGPDGTLWQLGVWQPPVPGAPMPSLKDMGNSPLAWAPPPNPPTLAADSVTSNAAITTCYILNQAELQAASDNSTVTYYQFKAT